MKAKMGVATDYKKYLKGLKKATDSVKKDKENKFIKRRMKLMGMPKLSKGSEKKLMTPEERADYVKKAKVRLKATAESLKDKLHPKKSDRLFSKHKKMGGGMMQKPMGYKSGMGPAGAAGPSAGRPRGRSSMQQGPKGGIGSMPKKRDGSQIIVMTKDGPKRITIGRSELDNMSAIEQKMGGGMMKARRGRIVDDQKRDKRNPNRKPSTKIFDKIGDILKTPYYIRGGKKEKKMGGGMMKKYSKGGGADSGKVGELKSKIAVATDKIKKHFQKRKKRPDYIKPPERKSMIPANVAETARSVASFTPTGMGRQIAKKLTGKMGGGMIAPSQRPGYSKGTMVKARGCKLGRTRPTKIT